MIKKWLKADYEYINSELEPYIGKFKQDKGSRDYRADSLFGPVEFSLERYTPELKYHTDLFGLYVIFDKLSPEDAKDLGANPFSYKWNHYWDRADYNEDAKESVVRNILLQLHHIGVEGIEHPIVSRPRAATW